VRTNAHDNSGRRQVAASSRHMLCRVAGVYCRPTMPRSVRSETHDLDAIRSLSRGWPVLPKALLEPSPRAPYRPHLLRSLALAASPLAGNESSQDVDDHFTQPHDHMMHRTRPEQPRFARPQQGAVRSSCRAPGGTHVSRFNWHPSCRHLYVLRRGMCARCPSARICGRSECVSGGVPGAPTICGVDAPRLHHR
jgi:hypothetical protein